MSVKELCLRTLIAGRSSGEKVYTYSKTWTHIIFTAKDSTWKVYKNGALVLTKTDGWEPNVPTRPEHWLGRSPHASERYFDGTIAYLKAWHGVEVRKTF